MAGNLKPDNELDDNWIEIIKRSIQIEQGLQ